MGLVSVSIFNPDSKNTLLLVRSSVHSPLRRYFWRNQSQRRRCVQCTVGCVHRPLCRRSVRWCWVRWRGPPPLSPLQRCPSPQSQWDFLWSVQSAGDSVEKSSLSKLLLTVIFKCGIAMFNNSIYHSFRLKVFNSLILE